jgi:hypothetical protein
MTGEIGISATVGAWAAQSRRKEALPMSEDRNPDHLKRVASSTPEDIFNDVEALRAPKEQEPEPPPARRLRSRPPAVAVTAECARTAEGRVPHPLNLRPSCVEQFGRRLDRRHTISSSATPAAIERARCADTPSPLTSSASPSLARATITVGFARPNSPSGSERGASNPS